MILAAIFGFISGIGTASIFSINYVFCIAVFILSLLCLFYRANLAFIFLIFVVAGFGRVMVSDLYSHSSLDNYLTKFQAGEVKNIKAEGVVITEPDEREANTKLTISLRKIFLESVSSTSPINVKENILVSVPSYPEFKYGDLVSVTANLVEPENFVSSKAGESERYFDYKNYLRVRGIWYIGEFPKVKYISSGHGSKIKSGLFWLKHKFVNAINDVLPEPESSLLSGLLLGAKQALGKDLLTEFSRAGVSHIVVLSGYNIAIVAETIMALLTYFSLPSLFTFIIGCISIILFTILSGGGASATRAMIMVLVALFAKKTNREYLVGRAFGFAVILMLSLNPGLLVFDPSFQLSILATIGIVFVSPIISPFISFINERFGLREIVSSTLATQIIVLPFLVYNTGLLSLVSLPANILILSTIPITMFLGFLVGAIGMLPIYFSYYLSFIPALPTYLLLWYQLKVVHVGSDLSFGVINLPAFNFYILVLIYIFIFVFLLYLKNRSEGVVK
jgi:competence protein ComEC